jgi:hypothetical protein
MPGDAQQIGRYDAVVVGVVVVVGSGAGMECGAALEAAALVEADFGPLAGRSSG